MCVRVSVDSFSGHFARDFPFSSIGLGHFAQRYELVLGATERELNVGDRSAWDSWFYGITSSWLRRWLMFVCFLHVLLCIFLFYFSVVCTFTQFCDILPQNHNVWSLLLRGATNRCYLVEFIWVGRRYIKLGVGRVVERSQRW